MAAFRASLEFGLKRGMIHCLLGISDSLPDGDAGMLIRSPLQSKSLVN